MIYLISFHLLFWRMFLQSLFISLFLNENFFSLSLSFYGHLQQNLFWTIFYTGRSFILGAFPSDMKNSILEHCASWLCQEQPTTLLREEGSFGISVAVLEVDFSVQALLNEQSIISQGLLSSVSFLLFHYSPHLPSEFKFLAILTV